MRCAVLLAVLFATLTVGTAVHAQSDAGVAITTGGDSGLAVQAPVELLRAARARYDVDDVAQAQVLATQATQADDARVAAQAEFLLADIAERRFAFGEALAHHRASVQRDPGGRYAARALSRIEYLGALGDGELDALAVLERVRRDPQQASDPRAIQTLATAMERFPPGRVRAEARLLVSQAWATRLRRPGEAREPLRAMLRDPTTPTTLRNTAMELLRQVRERDPDLAAAYEELRALGAPPAVLARMRQRIRRERLRLVAIGVCGLVLAMGVLSVVRAVRTQRVRSVLRAWTRPLPLLQLMTLSLGGALMVHTYEDHEVGPFVALGAGALLVYLTAAAWSVVGNERVAARMGRALVCAMGMLAVAFLAMHRYDVGMLEGIGL